MNLLDEQSSRPGKWLVGPSYLTPHDEVLRVA